PRQNRYDLKSLAYVAMMGTNVPIQLMQEFKKAFPTVKLTQGYGLTETSPFITLLPLEYAETKLGSIGLPVPDIEIKIMDEDGSEVPKGEVGEIVVKGSMVMKGYHNNPGATKAMIRDGWLYTGDLGKADQDGFFYHLGRKDDMIITGGLNVFPAEVENVIMRHPDVLEAGVVGIKDEDRGEIIKAAVVLKPNKSVDKKVIIDFCRKHLAGFKVPRIVEFRDILPKTSTGKVSRGELINS
ncbi:MAG: AMP-binding protein, partial [Proteobacteria bacterium]|nr:AMP-binding protein [Pseudomonadota bacterium]